MARKRSPGDDGVVHVLQAKKKPRGASPASSSASSSRQRLQQRDLAAEVAKRAPSSGKKRRKAAIPTPASLEADEDEDSEAFERQLQAAALDSEAEDEDYRGGFSAADLSATRRETRSTATVEGLEYEEEQEREQELQEQEEDEMAAPVVFQCGTCRSIFGDSYAFMGSNADLLLVTLSDVTNVALAPEAHTAKDGPDAGSSFRELLCKQCQAVLGRQYVTTPIALDELRGLFSFSTAAIASYQLGYPQLEGQRGPLSADATRQATAACDATVRALSADRDEVIRLREDMTKVQNLLLVVDDRLRHLETDEPDSEEEAAPSRATAVPR